MAVPPFPHGFKTACEAIAVEERAILGLRAWEPLHPLDLAAEHGVPVVPIDELAPHTRLAGTVAHLVHGPGAALLSGFTVCRGTRRLIGVNPSHTPGRQSSSVAHELAHLLLEHAPDQAVPEDGLLTRRAWTPQAEAEANWCAGVLLIPRPAALRFARNPHRREELQASYRVSEEMIDYRVNVTGAGPRRPGPPLTDLGPGRGATASGGRMARDG